MTPLPFVWQAWHLVTSTFISRGRRVRGRRGTYGIGWRAWSGFVARDAAAVCVAGVLLGDIHLHFTWQAWHKLTSTVVLRGRRGTCGIPSFCVAGVPLMGLGGALGPDLSPVTPLPFVWQAWYLVTSTFISRGRRGTNSHPPLRGRRGTYGIPSFCVAGVPLMGLSPLLFVWQAWYLVTSTFISRGRRGTNSHPPSFCVAGVALMAYLRFAWQAWHRRGTNSHPPSFCVAGVAQTHNVALVQIHVSFAAVFTELRLCPVLE